MHKRTLAPPRFLSSTQHSPILTLVGKARTSSLHLAHVHNCASCPSLHGQKASTHSAAAPAHPTDPRLAPLTYCLQTSIPSHILDFGTESIRSLKYPSNVERRRRAAISREDLGDLFTFWKTLIWRASGLFLHKAKTRPCAWGGKGEGREGNRGFKLGCSETLYIYIYISISKSKGTFPHRVKADANRALEISFQGREKGGYTRAGCRS